jgi:hypothetical protein
VGLISLLPGAGRRRPMWSWAGTSRRRPYWGIHVLLLMALYRRPSGRFIKDFAYSEALSEELQSRLGAETWNQRQRAASCIAFGVAHLINVIYAVATLGILVLVGAVYMIIYLLELRRTGDRRSAVVAASKFHANCNLTALTLILLTLLSTSSAPDGWQHPRTSLSTSAA